MATVDIIENLELIKLMFTSRRYLPTTVTQLLFRLSRRGFLSLSLFSYYLFLGIRTVKDLEFLS